MKKLLLACLYMCLGGGVAHAQLTDTFADGDFTSNPTWSGDAADFTVASEKLRSNSATANATFALSTPSTLATQAQWDFSIELQFNTSSTNYVDIWLTASEADLKSTTNEGYFVRIGNTADEISLYKKVGTTSTKLIDGTDGVTNFSSNSFRIFVTRDAANLWTLKHAPVSSSAFTTEGTATDASFTTSAYFGFSIKQSTASFFSKHFFDEINVGNLVIDTQFPDLSSVTVQSANTLRLVFNEAVLSDSAQIASNYTVNNGVGVATSAVMDGAYAVLLTFANNFAANQLSTLTVTDIADLSGNVMPIEAEINFTYVPPYVAQYRDIVINEIFADETPQIGLPAAEFLELYNASTTQAINLQGFVLSDATGSITLPSYTMQPNSYLVLCATSQVANFQAYGNVLGVSLPSLNNTGELLTLKNAAGTVLDAVDYKTAWYNDAVKANGGWSLEQINPLTLCTGSNNWTASVNPAGGTPATANSVLNTAPDVVAPLISAVTVLSSNQLQITFNERMDSTSLQTGAYAISGGLSVATAKSVYPDYKIALLTLASPLTAGLLYELNISNVKDCIGNLIGTNTNTFGLGAKAAYNELVISEIFADETPQVGLPLYEFLEITNRSAKVIDIGGMLVADTSGGGHLPTNTTLLPNEKVIVCGTTAASQYATFGRTFGISNFPSLNNTGETLLLRNTDGTLVFAVTYSDTWYQDEVKKQGGWTLEMIDTQNPCGGASNWRASYNTNGGTPAATNSIVASNPDNTPPQLTGVQVLSATQIVAIFSEPLDSLQALSATYQISGGIGVNAATVRRYQYDRVYITYSGTLVTGEFYTFTASNVRDCAGNLQTSTTYSFGQGAKPAYNELVISEILADETPQVGLPQYEFLELTNRSNRILDVSGMLVADTSGGGHLPANTTLLPNEKVIVCGTTAASQYAPLGRTFGIASFPSLNNSGETLLLRNTDGTLVFAVTYSDAWYQDEVKKQGGWALEMIDTQNPCGGASNWRASNNANGGTPAATNSVAGTNPDNTPPQLTGVQVLSATQLVAIFNEPLDSLQALSAAYQISGGISVSNATVRRYQYDRIYVTFSGALVARQTYTFTASNVRDCAGNLQSSTTVNFGQGRQPLWHELLITEIYADESPSMGLPEYEFLELYNNTDLTISLDGCTLSDATSRVKLPSVNLLPRQRVIVCGTSAQTAYSAYGTAYGISSFPTLNSSGDNMSIRNAAGQLICSVNYTDDWYGDAAKADGGWSLEMVDTQNPCGGASNWRASENPQGGTPAAPNSIAASNPDNTPPQILTASVLDAQTLQLQFSEALDSAATASSATVFSIDNGLTVTSQTIPAAQFDVVTLHLAAPMDYNKVYTLTISNLKDCAGNVAATASITFVRPEPADTSDILLNEVLFNPPTSGVDFVELYNHSNKYIDLKGWALANWSDNVLSNIKTITQTYILPPADYVAITTDKNATRRDFPKAIESKMLEMPSLPSYNDGDGTVILVNPQGKIVQRFDYDEKFHFPLLDDVNGVSLERISFDAPVNQPSSWQSAAANAGYGTPTLPNSQRINNLTSSGTMTIEPKAFTPDNDGDRDFTTIRYKFNSGNATINLSIYDDQGRLVRRLAQNQLVGSEGFYTWDGAFDNGQKARIGLYMMLMEITEPNGHKASYKESVAVGAKF
ncbi:C-terminal domain of CHU protein family protein [Flexibacter flexilis DSM 6793]|uniref:C-terminal domain of CHU protein family protein n=1 Tax=Flexibacter flexilis DSM 6793 TaxID=927664 RepID=A0A1I1G8C4_9BACT|nr:lamin tail domain-containing protein [Flexibacter flexilis]SFC07791.1 C-terminal domain of CHU protein family protein [Flexibacter flexilis DSM 6793]